MKTCLIISGGEFNSIPSDLQFDYVIACDHGFDHAKKLGIKPDILIGDFDSISCKDSDYEDVPIQSFDSRKDDTDTMLAIKHALSLGYNHIVLTCALGKRFDHTIANIQSMAYACNEGAECELFSDTEYMCTLSKCEKLFTLKKGYSFSLFSLTDECKGLSIKGSEYDCENITLTNKFPLGVSNKFKNETVSVSLEDGILLVVESLMQ